MLNCRCTILKEIGIAFLATRMPVLLNVTSTKAHVFFVEARSVQKGFFCSLVKPTYLPTATKYPQNDRGLSFMNPWSQPLLSSNGLRKQPNKLLKVSNSLILFIYVLP